MAQRLSIFILILCFSLPGMAKMHHALTVHKEVSCKADITTHYHEAEFDCEFQKFQISHSVLPVFPKWEPPVYVYASEQPVFSAFIYVFKAEHFSFLRGPPSDV